MSGRPSHKHVSVQEATRKIERFCAYQERCHMEVLSKLKEMRMIPEVIDHIMAHLIQENYLNEERFAKSFARGKFTIKKWGKNRIVNELKQRKISSFIIKIALREIDDEDYRKTLSELVQKRLAQLNETNIQRKKRKLADYLLYRGWESHLVYEKLKEVL